MIKSNTCIAVIKNKKGKLMMAGDRRQSWGMSQAQRCPQPKVIKRNGFLLGGTGHGGICNLITMRMPVKDQANWCTKTMSIDDYMYEVLMKDIKHILKDDFKKDGGIIPGRAMIVVGHSGHLYEIDINPDKTQSSIVLDTLSTPYATGCGGQLAWGSLLTTKKLKMSDKQRLITALHVAAAVSPGCDAEVDIIEED